MPNAPTTGTVSDIAIASYAYEGGFRSVTRLTIATAVALAESHGQVNARNNNTDGSIDRGLWQINSVHKQYDIHRLDDPVYNARAAYALSLGGNVWTPWSAFNNGSWKKYLGRAQVAATAVAEHGPNTPDVTKGYTDGGGKKVASRDPGRAIPSTALPTPNVLGGLDGIAGALGSLAGAVGKTAAWLGNPHNAARILEVIGGGAAVLIAVRMLADSGVDGPVGAAARGASKATKGAGKIAGAALLV